MVVPDVSSSVLVQQAEQPIITVTGPDIQPLQEDVLLHGHAVFGKVSIDSMTRQEREEMEGQEKEARVGVCSSTWWPSWGINAM